MPPRHDPLARATRTQRAGRRIVAITIVTYLALTPPVFELVERLAPGRLVLWIGFVLLLAIVAVARVAEHRQEPPNHARPAEPPA